MREQDWRANYYEAIRERNKVESVVRRIGELLPRPEFGEFTGNCCEHCAAIENFLDTEAAR